MSGFEIEDDNEHEADGDPPIDWERLAEVGETLATLPAAEALKALYGDDLEIL